MKKNKNKDKIPLKPFEIKALKDKLREIELSSFSGENKIYLKKKAKERYKV